MRFFHSDCGTTHCRAGWAVVLAGDSGHDLASKVGTATAGGLIYRVSTGRWPNFYCSNKTAILDMEEWAESKGK
jgi:hypothetical protein